MAKGQGGIRSNGASAGGFKKGATEEGYTPLMLRNVLGTEEKIKNNGKETAVYFNENGNKIFDKDGEQSAVKFTKDDMGKMPENGIFTHNHPSARNAEGIMRIGNSFSPEDIKFAMTVNAKEIRAVTSTYTFSMKRPKGGWEAKANKKVIIEYIKKRNAQQHNKLRRYVDERDYSLTAIKRANVLHWHTLWKSVAKDLGWNYTKKKN